MIRAVEHRALDVHHGVPREEALFHGLAHALIHSRDEAVGNGAALDLVHELVALAGDGGQPQPAVAELAGAAGLLLVTALGLGLLGNGLAVGNAHGNELRLYAGLLLQAPDQHVYLGLAHGVDDGLMRVLVARDADGGVSLGGAGEEGAELVLLLLRHSLDGHGVQGLGQGQRLDGDGALAGERVARAHVGKLRHHDDVAGLGALHVDGLFAHHDLDLAEALLLAGASADELQPRLQVSGDDLQEGEASDERVGHRLEGEGAGGLRLVDAHRHVIGHAEATVALRVREVGADVLHEALNALHNNGGSHEHRNDELLSDGFVQQPLQLLLGELLFALEVLHHKLVVGLGHQIAQLVAGVARLLLVLRRQGFHRFHALAAVLEIAGLHADDVDDALEIGALADGDGHRAEATAEAGVQQRHGGVEVGVLAIDVVDVHRARQTHILGLAPQLRRHDLGTVDGVHHEQGHLGRLHGGQRVADEVGVAGGVQHVDLVVLVGDGGNGGGDSELALDLLGVVIEVRLAVVGRAHARRLAGNEEHSLGQRGLAGAILSHKDDVSDVFGSRSCHERPPAFLIEGARTPCAGLTQTRRPSVARLLAKRYAEFPLPRTPAAGAAPTDRSTTRELLAHRQRAVFQRRRTASFPWHPY